MSTSPVVKNVTKENFLEESQNFMKELYNAAFVALDEEMTGISLPTNDGKRPYMPKDDDPSDRYLRVKPAAERYSIIQLGVTLFVPNESESKMDTNNDCDKDLEMTENTYEDAKEEPVQEKSSQSFTTHIYNFFLLSRKRDTNLNASAISFLGNHGLDFNMWLKNGITCATRRDMRDAWDKFKKRHNSTNLDSNKSPIKRKMQVTRPEDIQFIGRTMATLREWLDAPHSIENCEENMNSDENSNTVLELPSCNSFRRRALYETIEEEYPALLLEKGSYQNIRVIRLTPEEKKMRIETKKQQDKEKVQVEEVGLYLIFDALSRANKGLRTILSETSATVSDSDKSQYDQVKENLSFSKKEVGRKVPIIVHNGLMDLLFLLSHFHNQELPKTWTDCKSLINCTFPLIYDTKYMASECFLSGTFEKTSLSELYKALHTETEDSPEEDITLDAHNAGVDAFMTGCVFQKLCEAIMNEGGDSNKSNNLVEWLDNDCADKDSGIFGRNKLNLMQTMYNINLEDPKNDPMVRELNPKNTIRVSNISARTKTHDIVQATQGHDLDIIWVDDTTFMLHPRPVTEVDGETRSNEEVDGTELCNAMKDAFPNYTVQSFSDYLMSEEKKNKASSAQDGSNKSGKEGEENASSSWGILGKVISYIGSAVTGGPSKKRRRLE